VALPRGNALASLRRLRSPAWAAVLPGAVVVGTFAPLGAHSLAVGLILLAAFATPPLAAVAVLGVVRGPRLALVALALAAALAAMFAGGVSSRMSATILTVLGALALGAALARLIPGRWVLVGFTCMCAVDVALLLVGIGQPAAVDLVRAAGHVPGPLFDHAQVGRITLDYPDLVFSAALGGVFAGQPRQVWAAALVTVFSALSLMLAPPHAVWPATVPVAATLVAIRAVRLPRRVEQRAPVAEPATA
jgi:hypothetical protein